MSTAIAKTEDSGLAIRGLEAALLDGDLSRLNETQRIQYYTRVCDSVGLNPLTKPFEYLRLNGKMILYANRSCTDQLRKIHNVSIAIVSRERADGVFVVTARASLVDGRTDESVGAVPIEGLKGEALSNALMKAETKAKRRVTMAICGLSMLDELEVESLNAPRAAAPRRTLDDVAAGGQPAATRPTTTSAGASGTTTRSQDAGPASDTRVPARTSESNHPPSSTTTTARPDTTATGTDGELLDAKSWRDRYEAEAEAAMQAGAVFDAEDEHGMPMPPFPEPTIAANAKQHSGLPYSQVPGGYLREVIVGHKAFGERAPGLRLWALYSVARHEISKAQNAEQQS